MSKEFYDKYGNEIVKLEVKYNDKLQSICMNCFRIGGVKWNDIDNGSFLTLTLNKKDLIDQLVENEVKFDFDEDDDGETVKQVIVDDEKYIDIEYFAKIKADLEAKFAEKDKAIENWQTMYESVVQTCHNDKEEIERLREINLEVSIKQLQFHHTQDKISFALEQLEKVKELVEEKGAISSPFGNLKIQASDVSEIIDNQIKAIKEIK